MIVIFKKHLSIRGYKHRTEWFVTLIQRLCCKLYTPAQVVL